MSISARIHELDGKELKAYLPKSRLKPKRRLYLSKDAVRDLEDPNSATNILGLRGFIESSLTRWTLGERVFADANGKPRFLKRLCKPPPEIWEIRVTEPAVHVRLFGRFADPDTLILTKFHTRRMLGKKGSREWKDAMAACVATWVNLFPNHSPFSARTIHSYVTENCDDFVLCNA